MIPLQCSCYYNDHTAQLSLGGHAAHVHTQSTPECVCVCVCVCVYLHCLTHLNILLFSHAIEEGCSEVRKETGSKRKRDKEQEERTRVLFVCLRNFKESGC